MHVLKITALSTALAVAFMPAARAQTNDELMKELRELKERVLQLEKKLGDAEAKAAKPQWGMTPEQVQDFNRIAVKTEALEDNMEAQGLKALKISGYADPTYIFNNAQHRAGFQFLNPVASDGYNYDNSYFGAVSIDFQKEMEGGTKWRLTLVPNRGTGSVMGDSSIVHEASVMVPLGDLQTRFIAGQIPDWSGYEYLPATQNKLITHNLLFDFTLPTNYTGAGMEFVSGKWDTKVMLANLNASKRSAGEKTPVIAYRVDYSRGEFQGFGLAGVHGKAANFRSADVNPITTAPYDTRDTSVNLFEVDGYFIRGDLTWQGQLSYGTQRNAAVTADPVTGDLRDARWYGFSTLVAYKFIPRWEATARLDYINNKKNGGGLLGYTFADSRNGIGPDPAGDPEVGANRTALSLGLSYLLNLNTTLKGELRFDRASQPVFLDVNSGTYRKSNTLFGASAVISF
jgi:hypothetical protein